MDFLSYYLPSLSHSVVDQAQYIGFVFWWKKVNLHFLSPPTVINGSNSIFLYKPSKVIKILILIGKLSFI